MVSCLTVLKRGQDVCAGCFCPGTVSLRKEHPHGLSVHRPMRSASPPARLSQSFWGVKSWASGEAQMGRCTPLERSCRLRVDAPRLLRKVGTELGSRGAGVPVCRVRTDSLGVEWGHQKLELW